MQCHISPCYSMSIVPMNLISFLFENHLISNNRFPWKRPLIVVFFLRIWNVSSESFIVISRICASASLEGYKTMMRNKRNERETSEKRKINKRIMKFKDTKWLSTPSMYHWCRMLKVLAFCSCLCTVKSSLPKK